MIVNQLFMRFQDNKSSMKPYVEKTYIFYGKYVLCEKLKEF